MSSDHLSLDAAVVAASTTPSDLALKTPVPIQAVQPELVATDLVVSSEARVLIQQKAHAFTEGLSALSPHSPEFTSKLGIIDALAVKEIREASLTSNRILQRPMQEALQQAPQARVGSTLTELRRTVETLNPAVLQHPVKRFLRTIPFADRLRDYFDGYRSAQSHLDAITKSLAQGQDELRKDNAVIEGERMALFQSMEKMREYAALTEALDIALSQKAAVVEAAGDTVRAESLRSEALYSVRQKHQDLLTQLAVAMQGYMALDLMYRNNRELIKGVDRALTTTLSALRTAIIVSQALTNQRLVLSQITVLNQSTSSLMASTSEMLQSQGADINQKAAATAVELAKLELAFSNVFATMDAIDAFRDQSVVTMGQTVKALEDQVVKARHYLSSAAESTGQTENANSLNF